MADKKSVKLVVTFAERGKGKALAKLYAEQGVLCNYQSMGRGTASSDLLDVLGIGSAEKDILISITSGERSQRLLRRLDDGLESDIYGSGIVFDMSLTGLNSLIATVLLSGQESGNGGTQMEAKTDYSLILVSVNQGHTDDVMDTARQAGARGGTVIRARWAGPEDTSQFYGISLQSEKEIIAIVAAGDLRNAIMEMINKKHGLKTEAAAMVCSVGLEHYVKFS
ncbi:MAG TPA: hypothetical protein H9742_02125 [Candidatus Acetatifactor stercoripullorum]|uniref:Uncharacterized protein n=1 Tax=Candidatus Acetatifactor stercoripullorum TaxID=2838414 RepID=A0A9D1R273_9FIRM|nr:hypothetical protein [uncultured Acetatifactor sp.]HIW80316.1 hypothetical protein [Candidatus Acetatifactor stercoripullorum]